jgi:hypothetical protein
MGISKGHSVFFDIENNYKLLAILCHVVYATMGFIDLASIESNYFMAVFDHYASCANILRKRFEFYPSSRNI